MQSRMGVLRELVRGSLYVVDERAVAEAILVRGWVRAAVPDVRLRSIERRPPARSFRRDPNARSFHLSGSLLSRRTFH